MMRLNHMWGVFALALVVQACSCNQTAPATTASLIPEGERCQRDEECVTGLCAPLQNEPAQCRRACDGGCNALEICTTFGVGAGGKVRAGCVPEKVGLCQKCNASTDCAYPADVCLSIGGGQFCGRDCAFDDKCPDGYVCADAMAADGSPATRQCIPQSGTCECLPTNAGQKRPCEQKNTFGTCPGQETCDAKLGFSRCNAPVPAEESCNGRDDDCDGQIDEDMPLQECGVGECRVRVKGCDNGQIPVCTPLAKKTETCNGKDDDCDGTVDNGFDLASDAKNCGQCGTTCTVANGTAKCASSACAVAGCNLGRADCDGKYETGCEVNTQTDKDNCNGCGNACALNHATPKCVTGGCKVDTCDPGYTNANGLDADGCEYTCTPSGPEVCDGKDNDCDGQVDEAWTNCSVSNGIPACAAGQCKIAGCNPGWADCDGQYGTGCEMNTDTNLLNCGACNKQCAPANGTGQCVGGGCLIQGCNPGFANCDGVASNGCEADSVNDPRYCGGCGKICAVTNGTPGCASSACTVASCTTPFDDCDRQYATGCEVNKNNDVNNCGACGNRCPTRSNAASSCTNGTCGYACSGSYQDCDADPVNGCESDKLTDPLHCGSCTRVCSAPTNANATCANGGCGYACKAGFQDCDGSAANGCESNKNTDLANCGACNNDCPTPANSARTCTSGACGYTCSAGFQDCKNGASDGCESNKTADVNNCGACNVVCPARPHATAKCTGTCGITCDSGWADCNGDPVDGCEVDLLNDPTHCGSCPNKCPTPANGSATCTSGQCNSACTAPYQDCSATVAGCESNRLTDVDNCGACGNVCPSAPNATRTCSNGTCGFTCNTGFQDCSSASAGCESNKNSDLNNCGACGNVCSTPANATATCNGTCGFTCKTGYLDCTTAAGCETNKNTDADHCGTCTTVCPTPSNGYRYCSSGVCGTGCNSGYANCDSTVGCERRIDTNTGHPSCGAVTDLGTVSGDTQSGNVINLTGRFAEGTYKVHVNEDNSSCRYTSVTATLTSPSGLDYDLYAYNPSCGTAFTQGTSGGQGQTDAVAACLCDGCWGEDSGFDLWFEIVYFSGSTCGTWTLSIVGDTAVSTCQPGGSSACGDSK